MILCSRVGGDAGVQIVTLPGFEQVNVKLSEPQFSSLKWNNNTDILHKDHIRSDVFNGWLGERSVNHSYYYFMEE